MKNLFFIAMIGFLTLMGCGESNQGEGKKKPFFREGENGRYYGGTFHLSEADHFMTLFPQGIIDLTSDRIASQIFEGLVKFNQSDLLDLQMALAEDYEIDSSKTKYTFHLRKGVFFHDNKCFPNGKGREFTAEDVKYCFTLLCTEHAQNNGFPNFTSTLKGAEKYYKASVGGKKPNFEVEGINIIDDYTIELELIEPNALFLFYLAGPYAMIFPKEAYEKYGLDARQNPVGTGPFTILDPEMSITSDKVILVKNKNYYKKDDFGNKLPFLNAIEIKFTSNKIHEMQEFKDGKLEMIYRLPGDVLLDILSHKQKVDHYHEYILQRQPEMATHSLFFNTHSELFEDINVRKAFSFAIDRKKILEMVLDGEGAGPGGSGPTPRTFGREYETDNIHGYTYNEDSANYYWSKTAYGKEEKKFPEIELVLNIEQNRNQSVAEEIQRQLLSLGIIVKLKPLPLNQYGDQIKYGKADFYMISWMADYPHPHAFLNAFYGKNVPESHDEISYPNVARYVNKKFDDLFDEAIKSGDPKKAFSKFMEAENLLMTDCPFVVLWYDEAFRLLQPYVKNFENNPMQIRDFSEVFFEEPIMIPQGKK